MLKISTLCDYLVKVEKMSTYQLNQEEYQDYNDNKIDSNSDKNFKALIYCLDNNNNNLPDKQNLTKVAKKANCFSKTPILKNILEQQPQDYGLQNTPNYMNLDSNKIVSQNCSSYLKF